MVYKNMIGRPEATSVITLDYSAMTNTYTYHMSHLIRGYSGREKWDGNTAPEDIVEEMEKAGWSCRLDRDGFNRPRIHCTHTETQKVIDAYKEEQSKKFSGAERGYIRFGQLPENGRSKNHRDNTLEAGVSCFLAEFAKSGEYRILLTPVLEVSYLSICDRPAFRLYGEEVGTGADGEPLLNVKKATRI